jgi:hypothetical protein
MEYVNKFSLWTKLIIVFAIFVTFGILYAFRTELFYVDVVDQKLKVEEVDNVVSSGQNDMRRENDMSIIQDRIFKYHDKHNVYPAQLEDILVEKDLFTESIKDLEVKAFYDPTDKELYAYHLSADKSHFFLGASMETLGGNDFTADADGVVYDLVDPSSTEKVATAHMEGFGADDRGCRGERGRHCYDYAF